MTRAGLFRNRAEWAAPAILVAVLSFLLPFALVGYKFARVGVLYLSGFAAALANMEIVARLIDNRKLAGGIFLLTGVIGLVLLLALPDEWSYVDGENRLARNADRIPLYTFARGLLFGFAIGSGSFLRRPPASPPPLTGEERRARVRGALVVGGAVLGVFGFLFVLYVLGRYVFSPVLRYLL